jgi:rhodanese-related sulfurtransferase
MNKRNALKLTLTLALVFISLSYSVSSADQIVDQMVRDARAAVKEISARELKEMMDQGKKFALIDVREKSEYDGGHIKGSIHIPRGLLEWALTENFKDKNTPFVFYCESGARSALSSQLAQRLGYKNVMNLRGSMREWRAIGYKVYK